MDCVEKAEVAKKGSRGKWSCYGFSGTGQLFYGHVAFFGR